MALNIFKACNSLNIKKFISIGSACSYPGQLVNDLEEKDLFIDHDLSPINTVQKSFYKMSNKKIVFKNLKNKKIITKKFDDVVKKFTNLPKINFLNIDCEGHDYNVLSSINLNRYSPELICIETHEVNNKETVTCHNIIKLLNKHQYKIFKRCGPSTFFSN